MELSKTCTENLVLSDSSNATEVTLSNSNDASNVSLSNLHAEPQEETLTACSFEKIYWKYYLYLEQELLNTERYLSFDKPAHNNSYSIEYLKIMQLTCAEIDELLQKFCKLLGEKYKEENLHWYCKIITTKFPNFVSDKVTFFPLNVEAAPWTGWTWYEEVKEKEDGSSKTKIKGNNPEWWTIHNKIKHERGAFYKKANQENVLNALAALFQVESYIYRQLTGYDKVPTAPSSLFEMSNWEKRVIPMGGNVFGLITENQGYITMTKKRW